MIEEEKGDLFSAEENILKKAKSVLENKKFADNPLLIEFQFLLESYQKLLNQDKKIVKISDGLQNKIQKAKNEIENLNEISRQISMSLDFDIVFGSIFEHLKNTYGFVGCCLTLVCPDKTKCKNEKFIATEVFESLVDSCIGYIYSLKKDRNPIADCIIKNEISMFHDTNIFDQEDKSQKIKTAFLMPISISGEVIGAFSLIHDSGITLKGEEKESLNIFRYTIIYLNFRNNVTKR